MNMFEQNLQQVKGTVESVSKTGQGIKVNGTWYNDIENKFGWNYQKHKGAMVGIEYDSGGKNKPVVRFKILEEAKPQNKGGYGKKQWTERPVDKYWLEKELAYARRHAFSAATEMHKDDDTVSGVDDLINTAEKIVEWTTQPLKSVTKSVQQDSPKVAPQTQSSQTVSKNTVDFDDDIPF